MAIDCRRKEAAAKSDRGRTLPLHINPMMVAVHHHLHLRLCRHLYCLSPEISQGVPSVSVWELLCPSYKASSYVDSPGYPNCSYLDSPELLSQLSHTICFASTNITPHPPTPIH